RCPVGWRLFVGHQRASFLHAIHARRPGVLEVVEHRVARGLVRWVVGEGQLQAPEGCVQFCRPPLHTSPPHAIGMLPSSTALKKLFTHEYGLPMISFRAAHESIAWKLSSSTPDASSMMPSVRGTPSSH